MTTPPSARRLWIWGGKRTADFTLPLDISGWELGQHTLRLSARGTDGSVTDIAEYSVFVGDGKDGYDPTTGTLTVNMSSFSDQKGVIRSPQSLKAEGYAFRSTTGSELYLGHLDLSRYTAVRFYYSAVGAFFGDTDATIRLRSASDTVAEAVMSPADLPLSEVQTVTVDLTACDYSGELRLTIGHPTRKMCYLREIRFYEGEIPADTEESTETNVEATAEETVAEAPDTEAPTTPETAAPTDTQAPEAGCTATLPAAFFVTLALTAAASLPRRDRRHRRA